MLQDLHTNMNSEHVCARYIEAVGGGPAVPDEGEEAGVAIWSHLFKAVVALVG